MRKIFSLFLIFVLLLSSLPTFSSNDTLYSSWAETSIIKGKSLGLVPLNLQSNYSSKITRLEFASLIVNLIETVKKEKISTSGVYFSDTSDINVLKAAKANVVTGVGNSKFAPSSLITREQIAVMFIRALEYIEPGSTSSLNSKLSFADSKDISSWAYDFVSKAVDKKIMSGIGDNKIGPKGNATREQAIVLAMNLYNVLSPEVTEAQLLEGVKLVENVENLNYSTSETQEGILVTTLDNTVFNNFNVGDTVFIDATKDEIGVLGKVLSKNNNELLIEPTQLEDIFSTIDYNVLTQLNSDNLRLLDTYLKPTLVEKDYRLDTLYASNDYNTPMRAAISELTSKYSIGDISTEVVIGSEGKLVKYIELESSGEFKLNKQVSLTGDINLKLEDIIVKALMDKQSNNDKLRQALLEMSYNYDLDMNLGVKGTSEKTDSNNQILGLEGVELSDIYLASFEYLLPTMSVIVGNPNEITDGKIQTKELGIAVYITVSVDLTGEVNATAKLGYRESGYNKLGSSIIPKKLNSTDINIVNTNLLGYKSVVEKKAEKKSFLESVYTTIKNFINLATNPVSSIVNYSFNNYVSKNFTKYYIDDNYLTKRDLYLKGSIEFEDGGITAGPEVLLSVGGIKPINIKFHSGLKGTTSLDGEITWNLLKQEGDIDNVSSKLSTNDVSMNLSLSDTDLDVGVFLESNFKITNDNDDGIDEKYELSFTQPFVINSNKNLYTSDINVDIFDSFILDKPSNQVVLSNNMYDSEIIYVDNLKVERFLDAPILRVINSNGTIYDSIYAVLYNSKIEMDKLKPNSKLSDFEYSYNVKPKSIRSVGNVKTEPKKVYSYENVNIKGYSYDVKLLVGTDTNIIYTLKLSKSKITSLDLKDYLGKDYNLIISKLEELLGGRVTVDVDWAGGIVNLNGSPIGLLLGGLYEGNNYVESFVFYEKTDYLKNIKVGGIGMYSSKQEIEKLYGTKYSLSTPSQKKANVDEFMGDFGRIDTYSYVFSAPKLSSYDNKYYPFDFLHIDSFGKDFSNIDYILYKNINN